MPAFSRAIPSSEEPRYSVCSNCTPVTALTSGSSTFVLSSRPPNPTSTTAISIPLAAKSASAIAVVASKKLAPVSSMASSSREAQMAKVASEIGVPSTSIRSRTVTKWGEVYTPTRHPLAMSASASSTAVEPFPLVPPIWMDG